MDNKKNTETNTTTDKISKDRGDLKKPVTEALVRDKPGITDHGDKKLNTFRQKPETKTVIYNETGLKIIDKFRQTSQVLYDKRRRIRDKYTIRYKNNQNCGKVNVFENVESNREVGALEKDLNVSSKMGTSLMESQNVPEPDREAIERKPVMKLNTSRKNIAEVLRVASKKNQSVQLNIGTPLEHNKNVFKLPDTINTTKSKIKTTVNHMSEKKKQPVTQNPIVRKRPKIVTSPETSAIRSKLSPITEVAKWAPKSITHDTRPYYEAWVDTTLAAISKDHPKDKLFIEKKNIMKDYRRQLEIREKSPDLFYKDYSDVKFTGRIKVRQR